jgi:hypothetical protein
MLKRVELSRKPNGDPIMIPVTMNETIVEQQVKLLIELADYNLFDAHMHLSLFHHFHGKMWTLRVLDTILQELQQPSIEVTITRQRGDSLPFFETEQKTHLRLTDNEYNYPPEDISQLPL